MATITKRGGSYQAAVTIDGKRIRKAFGSEAEAEQFVREAQAKAVLGIEVNLSSTKTGATVQEVFDLTERDCWSGKRSEEALLINGRAVVDFFGPETRMKDIDERRISEFVAHLKKLGNANGTVNRKLAALSKMFVHAMRLRLVTAKPFIKKEREPQGRIRYLTKGEEENLVGRFKHLGYLDYADLCTVLVDTGARVGEILKLEWKDVSGRILHFWETKNGVSRSVPLTTRASEVLERRRDNGLPGPFSAVSQNSFNHTWTKVKSLIGMEEDTQFVPHVLRHTCASRLVQAGVPILSVKEYLGHKSMTVTLRYAHLAPKQLWQAMEVLDRGSSAA